MSRLKQELDAQKAARTPQQRILCFDVESAPSLAFAWQAKTEYINPDAFTHETFLLTWAAKWVGQKKVHAARLTADEAREQDDARIVQGLADLVRSADIVVAHNGNKFDIPKLNTRLLLLGLEPLGDVKTIDTLTLARRSFRLLSNRLDYLAQQLGVGAKLHTTFDLWKRAYHGDDKALARMDRYCRQDVRILEDVFLRIAPYSKGLPRLVDGDGQGGMVCPSCGSDQLTPDGAYRTNATAYPRFRCECGRTSRSRKADSSLRLELVPLQ